MDDTRYPNYVLFAHGCDIIDAEQRPVIKKIVKGNIYITTTTCGTESVSNVWGETLFNLQNNAQQNTLLKEVQKKPVLDDSLPYSVTDGIKKFDYVDNMVTPIFDINVSFGDYIFMLYRSGLIPIDYIQTHKDVVFKDKYNYSNVFMFSYQSKTKTLYRSDNPDLPLANLEMPDKPLEQLVKMAFAGSVYPTVEEVLQIFHTYAIDAEPSIKLKQEKFIAFKKELIKTFTTSISALFEKFPGTYFNTSCRAVCGSTVEDNSLNEGEYVNFRRENSLDYRTGGMKRKTNKRKTRKRKTKKRKTKRKTNKK